ncbi:MAG: MFS family permease [Colwellia sp.]
MFSSEASSCDNDVTRLYCLALVAGFSLGIFPPLVSILMETKGVKTDLIGFASSSYFITMALTAPLASRSIDRWGIKPVIFVGALCTALLSGCFAFIAQLELWFILRALSGVGMGLFLVAGQTAINLVANNDNRTRVATLYSVLLGIGFGIGPVFAAHMYSYGVIASFLIASAIIIIGLILVGSGFYNHKPEPRNVSMSASQSLLIIALPLHFILAYGVLESVMISVLPAILLQMGGATESTGYPFFAFIACSGLGMAVVGQLEKILGKQKLLMLATAVGTLLLFGISGLSLSVQNHGVYGEQPAFNIEVLLFACGSLGFCLGPMFPLILSIIGDLLEESELAMGSAWFTGMFSFGCGLGPILSSLLVVKSGHREWLFLVSAVLFASVLIHWLIHQIILSRKFKLNKVNN